MNENKLDFRGVGKRIAQKLEELNLTQKDVYSVTGFSKTTMSNYVNGRRLPNTSELYQLAKFLKVSMEWLLTGEENTTNVNLTQDISPEDIELLAKFHQLDEMERAKVEGVIDGMLMSRQINNSRKESSRSKSTGRGEAAAESGA
ncbi:helix-turn-helix domain-containing protein [Paenibacillus naphthalenovorans]|uniref:helix-turn-helix domain-containing protein n=1 Tax=Paenibacillus naphthalenovorans TaxID=162209 RepID=UPI003D2656D5